MEADLNLEHILPARRSLVLLKDKQRISAIYEDRWVNHPQVALLRATARALYEMPPRIQAQCMLISGRAGMGKTSLLKKIELDLEVIRKRNAEACSCIAFSLAPDPTLNSFEDTIGEALGVPIGKIRNGLVSQAFCRLAHLRNLRLLLIDELHNLLNVGRIDQRKNLAFLRALSSPPMSLSIIAFGVDDAVHAIKSDAQLERRFQIYDLPPWKQNDSFRAFLTSYEGTLPLRYPSELWQQEKVNFLLSATDGMTDNVVKCITRGAAWAILDGKERIDLACLEKAIDIPPYHHRFDDEE
ncbi:TniB family NTP-binding protein [Pseudomonas monsensis]|uniref:TniB family NTP-binding protein n=1 Tax=Pseudomonas monsensis TaxID=2745509 RepID=UPI002AB912A6|nr:TniB family NTP-binding protein [Pseudomonas monsensis]MDZ3826584.1 TniB family NTP-binding protein [Pseudomonas monsensis]